MAASKANILSAIDKVIMDSSRYQTEVVVKDYVLPALSQIKQSVQKEWPLSDAAKKQIWIGPFAAKNIADWNPELADNLMTLDYTTRHDGENIEMLLNENKSNTERLEL